MSLPRVKTIEERVINYFGSDPIEGKFRVLCMTKPHINLGPACTVEHQVLTLETGEEPEWRMIECDIIHSPFYVDHRDRQCVYDGICINGVLYYFASHSMEYYDDYPDIVCFDVRSEKFNIIKKARDMKVRLRTKIIPALVNYKGGLAQLQQNYYGVGVYLELWVLKDTQKHRWTMSYYVLPPLCGEIMAKTRLCCVGVTSGGEIVLSPNDTFDSFYLIYYNPGTNITTKVRIQGMEAFRHYKVHTFLDHVEDVKLIESV